MTASRLLAVAALLFVVGCRQTPRYFVDLERAAWGTEAGKRAQEKLQRDLQAKQREVTAAVEAAGKAEASGLPTAAAERARANETAQRLQGEWNASRDAERSRLIPGLRSALVRVAADRRVAVVELASEVAFVDPSADVTDEVIRRADDTARASEVAALKAENERLKAKGKP